MTRQTSASRRTEALSARSLFTLALGLWWALGACSESHGPQVGDTNTNWLRMCEKQRDCNGQASCIRNRCTLSCDAVNASVCGEISVSATCDVSVSACEVLCSQASDCRNLGANYTCREAACRPAELQVSAKLLKVSSDSEQEPQNLRYAGFDSIWLGDHWRIAAQGLTGDETSLVRVADVFPDERVAEQMHRNDDFPVKTFGQFTLAQDGSLVEWAGTGELPPAPTDCQLRFYGPASIDEVHTLAVDCASSTSAAPVAATGDWIVSAQRRAPDAPGTTLGRYRAQEDRWVLPPQALTVGEPPSWTANAALFDGQLWFLSRTKEEEWQLASIPVPDESSVALPPLDWKLLNTDFTAAGPGPGLVNGWVLPVADPLFPANLSFDAEGVGRAVGLRLPETDQPLFQVPFALAFGARATLLDAQPLAAGDVVALCHSDWVRRKGVTTYSLFVSVFDASGALHAGPALVTTSARKPARCTVSGSPSQVLAAWFEEGAETPLKARMLTLR